MSTRMIYSSDVDKWKREFERLKTEAEVLCATSVAAIKRRDALGRLISSGEDMLIAEREMTDALKGGDAALPPAAAPPHAPPPVEEPPPELKPIVRASDVKIGPLPVGMKGGTRARVTSPKTLTDEEKAIQAHIEAKGVTLPALILNVDTVMNEVRKSGDTVMPEDNEFRLFVLNGNSTLDRRALLARANKLREKAGKPHWDYSEITWSRPAPVPKDGAWNQHRR